MEARSEGPVRLGGEPAREVVQREAAAPSEPPPELPRAELPKPGTQERRLLDLLVGWVERRYGEDFAARVAALKTSCNEAGFDPFGFDPEVIRHVLAALVVMHRTYFRTEVFGMENVPTGRALFIGNHSGHLPIDGMIIASALLLDRDPPVLVRSMVEKWAQRLPFISVLFMRSGQVLGAPDNARRLLEAENPLLVFPEGVRGLNKPFSERYKLTEFGPGFMRLAMETRSPIVPVAVVGAEEQFPAVANVGWIAKMLGMPAFPVVPHVLMGLTLPLPTRYRLYFGEPMYFEGDHDEDDADIEERVEAVRNAITSMLKRGLAERRHIFW
ncbi:MAG TPA: lysophospholipid acyltransferase family protein [Polyangiales bacterium]